MKILQVNCVYKKGSTGKITYDLHNGLLECGYESVVCYGRGKKDYSPNVYKTCGELYSKINNVISRFSGVMYGGCNLSTWNLIRKIKREKPDIVHLQCINGYFVDIYKIIGWLKRKQIKTVVTLHAEFMYTANCAHSYECDKWKYGCGKCERYRKETHSFLVDGTNRSWKKMYRAFLNSEQNIIITSVSPWLAERARQSPILEKHKHYVVYNGVDINVFNQTFNKVLYEQYKKNNKKLILHVTARFGDQNKGGSYLLELANKIGSGYMILLVGKDIPSQEELPNNVMAIGEVCEQKKLASLYSFCDVTVITSQRETFSMICAESLCCGTPVVGFKSGAPEQISLAEYSEFVEFGDVDGLIGVVKKWTAMNLDKKDIACEASKKYAKEVMVQNYIHVYEKLLKGE